MIAIFLRPREIRIFTAIGCGWIAGLTASCTSPQTELTREPAQASLSAPPATATAFSTAPLSEVELKEAWTHAPYSGLIQGFSFDLYKGEAWKGGSRKTEINGFLNDAREIAAFQESLRKQRDAKVAGRAFHQKQHGCLIGEMRILNDRPQDSERRTFVGLFARSSTHQSPNFTSASDDSSAGQRNHYPVLVRFSNGAGRSQPDAAPDLRGAALKIFNVRDELTHATKTVDFPMTSIPNPPGHDQADFVDFMRAIDIPLPLALRTQEFLLTHPLIAERLIGRTINIPNSVAEETYWSGHPYLLGFHDAMKFNLRPTGGQTQAYRENPQPKSLIGKINAWIAARNGKIAGDFAKLSFNFLREELTHRAQTQEIHMTLSVQLEKDPTRTPIENAFYEWTEEASPSIPVAELVFPKQRVGDPELENLCQNARFTPGHYVAQHRPLSNMGRGRLFGYAASQNGRGADPTEITVDELRTIANRIMEP